MNWTVCIDFGTAFSKAAAVPAEAWNGFKAGLVRPLMLNSAAGNPFILDSAVFVEQHKIAFGARAVTAAAAAGGKRQALRSFKTLLSAPDLDRVLAGKAPASIDPTRSLLQRDLVVLYLAFLMDAVKRGIAADPSLSGPLTWRYACPAWRDDRMAAHRVIERLFGEAQLIIETLRGRDEVEVADARRALEEARSNPAASAWRMDMVYEATAAAACSAAALAERASHVIVVDIGAGTTDIAALAGADELVASRFTLTKAGDFLDRILLNLALAASRHLKTTDQQTELWMAMAPQVRELKEALFASGRCVFRHGGRVINITLKDFERDKDFKEFLSDLTRVYQRALRAVCERARADRQKQVLAIAVGGGAPAPFIQKLIGMSAPVGGVKVMPRPATPEWASDGAFAGNLAPVFPQLAVAIGGALAPNSILAAYDRASV